MYLEVSVLCVLSRCGLVALWMAAHLRRVPLSVDMETVVQTALSRGYTAQGEMFSGNLHGMNCRNHKEKSRAFLSLRFCFFTQGLI